MSAGRRAPQSVRTCAPSGSAGCSPLEPDLEHILEHVERAADRAHLRDRRVAPYDRDLCDPHTLLLGSIENFRVISKSLAGQASKCCMGDVGAKELEAALCVPDARKKQGLHYEVEALAHELAIERLRDLDP